ITYRQGIDESATGSRDVAGGCPHRAEPVWNEAGRGRQRRIAGAGRHQNQVKIGRGQARRLQGAFGRFDSPIGAGLARSGNAALADAGSFDNPGIGRGDHSFEVSIREYTLRNIGPGSQNSGSHADGSPLPPCWCCARLSSISRWMSSTRRPSASPLARPMAFLIALTDECPWQIILVPFTPSRGAPPNSA